MARECTHPQARHQHGTRAAYVKDRCRCTDCTAANTAASRTATRERVYGRWQPYVDAGPVREHIAALRAAGIGVERIAHLASLSVSHIRELAEQRRGDSTATRRVRPNTATRILAIAIDNAHRAQHSRVDATGTRRRLQALIAIGWPAELLAALYERLWNARPPRLTAEQRVAADAARVHAAARGWLPPLAWDDIDTDPTPPPAIAGASQRNEMDEIAVERALAGDHITYDDLTSVEQQEVIRRLTARGSSIRNIAAQLGTTKRTVSRRRASLALHDHRAEATSEASP